MCVGGGSYNVMGLELMQKVYFSKAVFIKIHILIIESIEYLTDGPLL